MRVGNNEKQATDGPRRRSAIRALHDNWERDRSERERAIVTEQTDREAILKERTERRGPLSDET